MQKDEALFRAIAENHIPEAARFYCLGLYKKYPFFFILKPDRKSVLGNYRYEPATDTHVITVNKTLNPYAFLITYLHEVAHLVVKIAYKRRMKPHGEHWKQCFRELLYPMMTSDVFPEYILKPLKAYMKNPKASSLADIKLAEALYPELSESGTMISTIPDQTKFKFQEKTYLKISMKRSRCLCKDLTSRKEYLILGHLRAEICA